MKKWLKILICALAGVLALGSVSAAFAAGITLALVPAVANYEQGDEVIIGIIVSTTERYAIGGYHVQVQYDPSKVSFEYASLRDGFGKVAAANSVDVDLNDGFLVANDGVDNSGNQTGLIDVVYINSSFKSERQLLDSSTMLHFTLNTDVGVGNSIASFSIVDNYEIYNADVAVVSGISLSSCSINSVLTGTLNMQGYINGDGKVDYKDAVAALRAGARFIKLTDKQKQRGDTNNDGKVNYIDAVNMFKGHW